MAGEVIQYNPHGAPARQAHMITDAEVERLYQAVMLAAPMALLGVALFLAVWLWPIKR